MSRRDLVASARRNHDRCGATAHVPFPPEAVESTLVARFDAVAELHAGCVAVSDDGVETTYAELDARARAIAASLVDAGARPGEPVALIVDQGLLAVAAVLGVLRAGCAFAPLDPLDPPARAAELLRLAGCSVLVASGTRTDQAGAVAAASRRAIARVTLGDEPAVATGGDGEPPGTTPGSPASLFFTSGSTGRPKAVLDLHRNVLDNVRRYTDLLELRPTDRLSLVQRPSFSGIASSLFGALLNGATLCPFPLSADSLPDLADWVRRERVTVFHAVPVIFRALVARGGRFPDVRVVRLEGDRASWDDVARFRRVFPPKAMLANGLGTTETGLACQFRVTRETPVEEGVLPVGYPAPGVEIVLLDGKGLPAATGATGEIAVRSPHLAAGYVGAPDLTAERFRDEGDGWRLYRTGDLGRLGTSGRLEYLGRVDGLFKVGGTRVEPAEVEAALMRLDLVSDAAVTVEAAHGDTGRLVARVVAARPEADADVIRELLAEELPDVMIPSEITVVEDLGVDANWKLVRRATRRPATALEREIQAIWEEVLETEVGLDDPFVRLGGDSLSAAVVAAQIEERLGIDAPLSLLARAPTVSRLAAVLGTEENLPVSLAVLRDRGQGPPLVLIPDHRGHALMYASLAAAFDDTHPIWGVEIATTGDDVSIPGLAAHTVGVVRTAQPEGPYVIGGFCYGAILALETARILRADGATVVPVLLGLEPPDVPSLVGPAALAAWGEKAGSLRRSVTRARHHVRLALAAGGRSGFGYLFERALNVSKRVAGNALGHAGLNDLQRAARAFSPAPLRGSATLVVGSETVARYADDPRITWAGLAGDVDVRVVPGVGLDAALLTVEAPRLAAVLTDVVAAAAAQTVP